MGGIGDGQNDPGEEVSPCSILKDDQLVGDIVGLRWTSGSRLCIYASSMGIWEFDFVFMISVEKNVLTQILLLFVDCFY